MNEKIARWSYEAMRLRARASMLRSRRLLNEAKSYESALRQIADDIISMQGLVL